MSGRWLPRLTLVEAGEMATRERDEIHISEIARAEYARINWHRVHLEADRRPWMDLRFNVGRWSR